MTRNAATPLISAPWLTAPSTTRLLAALTADGQPARFVGGCVRDALLGRDDADGDLDIATSALPDQVIGLLETAGIKVVPTGLAHGTVTAIIEGQPFEVTTLREDIACDGRHARVRFTDDFAVDAARRDFTINAMSAAGDGRLYDYFGGRDDLAAGRVRFVGDARRRVAEDHLRILRFFRFFAGYGRPPADSEALAACRAAAGNIRHLSGERIRNEMLKLLRTDDPLPALDLMHATGVLAEVLPGTADLAGLRRLVALVPDADPLLRLAALLRPTPDAKSAAAGVATAWRLAKAEAARLDRLATARSITLPASAKTARRDLYRLGADIYADLARLAAADIGADAARGLAEALGRARAWTVPVLPVRGRDLIDRGVPPGPELGSLLKRIEGWWLDRDMRPGREACLAELDRLLARTDG